MAQASTTLHESEEKLGEETVDRHRAIVSLMEELEAVDWYDQRVAAATDAELKEILAHNRDEEKEHAAMVLEWLRRRDARLDQELRHLLFSDGAIVPPEHHEEVVPPEDVEAKELDGSLGIGSLKT